MSRARATAHSDRRHLLRTDPVPEATVSLESRSYCDPHVFEDDDWHSFVDGAGEWRIGLQLAPNHVPPEWPHGTQQQQVHLDLHVDDPRAAHEEAMGLGARLLRAAPDFGAREGHQVYANPAGHPSCIGGTPVRDQLAAFVADRLGQKKP